ncbi:MAG: hypothetical protein ACRDFB_04795 [Rhabdochlamydiaceae bacterium]
MKHKQESTISSIDQHSLTLFYFKVIYEKTCQMANFAFTYFDSSHNERLDKYYQTFHDYLFKMVTIDDLDTWRDVVHKLPANLNDETLYDAVDDWHETIKEANEGICSLNELSKTIAPLPKWLSEAIHNIDGWLVPPVDLDISLINHAYERLTTRVKEINEQVQGKIVIEQNGTAIFYAPTGKPYTGTIKKGTNAYKMLDYLNKAVGKVKSPAEIEVNFNKSKGYPDTKLRVRDTAVAIKNSFGLFKTDEIFIVNRGYGLKYSVEFK